jgi:hypothetical protein
MGKRGPTCSICKDPRIEEINRSIASQEKLADISRELAVSEDALSRHKEKCIITALSATPNTKDVINGDNLLAQLQEARSKAIELLDMAIAAGDTKVYGPPSSYLSEIRQQIKLWAELEGRLSSQPQITIINNPEWVELRTVIIEALEPYKDAREAVLHAIRG